jgi:aminocarboxymuconate-semialdehyde decarboxylase
MIDGRLDFGYRLGYKGLPHGQAPACQRKPSEYLHTNFYVDTMGFSPKSVKHVIDLLGSDRVVFGSDYAAVPISPKEQVEIIRGLGLSREDQEKVLWKNAARLFGIGDSQAS